MLDGRQLVNWNRTQGTVARSLGEAKFLAAAVASYELLGVASILREIGAKVEAHVRTDSNVCRAILSRFGSGRMEHLETKPFAMQQWIRRGRLTIARSAGVDNPTDFGTKSLGEVTIARLLPAAGLRDGGEKGKKKVLAAMQGQKVQTSTGWIPGPPAARAALVNQLPIAVSK